MVFTSPANRLYSNASTNDFPTRADETLFLKQRIKQLNPGLGTQFKLKKDAVVNLILRMILPKDTKMVQDAQLHVPSYLAVSLAIKSKLDSPLNLQSQQRNGRYLSPWPRRFQV